MDRRAWQATVHGVTRSWTRISDSAQHSTVYLQVALALELTDCLRLFSYLISFQTNHQDNSFIYFSWRIITLQYFDGFCHTSTGVYYRHTCVPSLLNSPPTSLLAGCHRVPALGSLHHIKFPLATYFTYGNVYAPVLFSQIIPLQPFF